MSSTSNRRQFLKYTSGFAISQLPWLSSCATKPVAPTSGIPAKDWKEFGHSLKGKLLMPGDSGFETMAKSWNLRFQNVQSPAGIARCRTQEDVQASLKFAQDHKIPLVARSGGHSYSGYSTTPGLMIELKLMHDVGFDKGTLKATVGGGSQNATLYKDLPPLGVAVTHGRCSSVGVGGLVLAGGIGFNMRHRGLLIDQLKETRMVTADGKLHVCNDKENSDLFWACRGGGGGNFGINTSFTFQTFEVNTVTAFNIFWDHKVDEILYAALQLLPGTTDRLGCKLSVTRKAGSAQPTVELLGQLLGDEAELKRILAPLYRIAETNKESQIKPNIPYWDAQHFLGEDATKMYSYERSRYGFGLMSSAGCKAVMKHIRAWPGTHAGTSWKMFLVGGQIDKLSNTDTAYCHRKASMLTSMELNWTGQDSAQVVAANTVWLNTFHDDMRQYTSGQCYQNFIDGSQKDYLHAYYGGNLGRLVQVKRKYDPKNVFHFPQSIPLSV